MPRRQDARTPEQKRLGRKIRQVRRAAGLTQRELGAATGVTADFLQKIELGYRLPSGETLVAIAKALKVTVAHLGQKLAPEPERSFGALADRVRKAREAAGLLQRDLAARVGLSADYIQQVEAGRDVPSRRTIAALAGALRVRQAELLHAASKWKPPPISRTLRKLRKAAGLSVFKLAVRAGLTQNHVQAIETGRRLPSDEALRRLADALRVEPATLTKDLSRTRAERPKCQRAFGLLKALGKAEGKS